VSRDGRFVTFAIDDSLRGVWIAPVEGGEPRQLSSAARTEHGDFSPSGDRVLLGEDAEDESGLVRTVFRIVPVSGGETSASARLPAEATRVRWGPTDQSLTFVHRADANWNVYRQRLEGGTPEPVTRFTEGRITDYRWAPDGARLAVVRNMGAAQNVWVMAADGSRPSQVTTFTTGVVFDLEWMPDSRRIVVNAGTRSRDAVLIREFRAGAAR